MKILIKKINMKNPIRFFILLSILLFLIVVSIFVFSYNRKYQTTSVISSTLAGSASKQGTQNSQVVKTSTHPITEDGVLKAINGLRTQAKVSQIPVTSSLQLQSGSELLDAELGFDIPKDPALVYILSTSSTIEGFISLVNSDPSFKDVIVSKSVDAFGFSYNADGGLLVLHLKINNISNKTK